MWFRLEFFLFSLPFFNLQQLEQIQKELSVLEEDIKRVEEMSGLYSPVSEDSTVPQFEAPSPSHSSIIDSTEYSQPPGFSGTSQTKKQPWYNSTLASRRKRLTAYFVDLEQCSQPSCCCDTLTQFLMLG